jgi:hypothetical protein
MRCPYRYIETQNIERDFENNEKITIEQDFAECYENFCGCWNKSQRICEKRS